MNLEKMHHAAAARGVEARMATVSIANTPKFLKMRNANISFSFHFLFQVALSMAATASAMASHGFHDFKFLSWREHADPCT
jgi:hypothetical protein